MPSIATSDFKNGIALELPEGLFALVEFQHVNPGKGAAFVRTKLKNVRSGAVIDRTFRAGERVERAIIDQREMQLLYTAGSTYVFMDQTDYEQLEVADDLLGSAVDYLKDGMSATIRLHEGRVVGVDLPASVVLEIAETEPGVQGDRVSGATKPAKLESGKSVRVPLFVNPGDRVVVDTRTGDYISRARD